MTTITRDSLAQAAQECTGITHLSLGQAWAAHHLEQLHFLRRRISPCCWSGPEI